jgi:hypothetical protein
MRVAALSTVLVFALVLGALGSRASAQAPVLVVNGQAVASTPVSTTPVSADEAPGGRGPRRSRPGQALLISGIVVLAAGWAGAIAIGAFGGYHDRTCIDIGFGSCSLPPGTSWDPAWDDFRASSLAPIAGPWIELAVKPPSGPDGWVPWLVIDGILQGAGAILLFVGIGLMGSDDEEPPPVAVVPMVSPSQAGLQVLGSF